MLDEKFPYDGQHPFGRLDKDSVFEVIQDNEFGVGQGVCHFPIESGVAAAVLRTSDQLAGHRYLMKPWRHLGLGIDIEDIQDCLLYTSDAADE